MALSYKDRLKKLLDGDDGMLKNLTAEIDQCSKTLETYEDRVASTQKEMAKYRNVLDEKIRSSREIIDETYISPETKYEPQTKYEPPRKMPSVNSSYVFREKPAATITTIKKEPETTPTPLPPQVTTTATLPTVQDNKSSLDVDPPIVEDTLQKIMREASERRVYEPRVVDNYFASPYREPKPTSTKNIPEYARRYFESKDNIESKHIISRFNYMPR